jgi:hypothetical protein
MVARTFRTEKEACAKTPKQVEEIIESIPVRRS